LRDKHNSLQHVVNFGNIMAVPKIIMNISNFKTTMCLL